MGAGIWRALVGGNRADKTLRITLHGLNRAERTIGEVVSEGWNASANSMKTVSGLRHRSATAFDSIAVITTGGTVTGRYTVRYLT